MLNASPSPRKTHFRAADVFAELNDRDSTRRRSKKADTTEQNESIQLVEIKVKPGAQSHAKDLSAISSKLMSMDKDKDSFESQRTVSTSPDGTKNTSFDSLSSPEEGSSLIIENKHTDRNKNVTATEREQPAKTDTSVTDTRENTTQITTSQQTQTKSEAEKKAPKTQAKRVPEAAVVRTLPTPDPVTGKELKFNPHTGQFKKKSNVKKDSKKSNDGTTVDNRNPGNQSVVIVNTNATD